MHWGCGKPNGRAPHEWEIGSRRDSICLRSIRDDNSPQHAGTIDEEPGVSNKTSWRSLTPTIFSLWNYAICTVLLTLLLVTVLDNCEFRSERRVWRWAERLMLAAGDWLCDLTAVFSRYILVLYCTGSTLKACSFEKRRMQRGCKAWAQPEGFSRSTCEQLQLTTIEGSSHVPSNVGIQYRTGLTIRALL